MASGRGQAAKKKKKAHRGTFSQSANWVNAFGPMPPGPRLVGAESNKTTEAFMQACFAAGTLLLTPHGVQPIERFRVGDAILSRPEWDPAGSIGVKIVEEVFVRTAELWNLHVGGQVIRTTAEHPFWVQGRGWTPVRELHIGDLLSSNDGQSVHVEDLLETGERAIVYNLRVSDWHTYFVGTSAWGFSIWAHNADYAEDNRSWWQIGADFVESRKERFVDGLGQLERGFEALPAASVQKAEEIWENAGNIRHGRVNPNFVRGLKMIVDDPIENIPQTGKIGALNLAAPAMELGRAIGEGDERKIMTAGAHVGMQYMGARTTIQSFGPKIPELAPKSGFFGARGPASLREFDPAASGGPIRQLTTNKIKITEKGVTVVEEHVARFGPDTANQGMIQRLRDIQAGRLQSTQTDLNFYSHELRESVRYRRLGWRTGQPGNPDAAYELWNNAHTATLEDYLLQEGPGVLYHPSVGP